MNLHNHPFIIHSLHCDDVQLYVLVYVDSLLISGNDNVAIKSIQNILVCMFSYERPWNIEIFSRH